MLSTINSRVTNFIAIILMLTVNGRLLAWSLPTHCLHSLGTLLPLQRAFRQCVEHVQTMWYALPGGLLACLVPTDCLRSLKNRPPFHRAFRQYVGNPEAIGRLHDKPRQQPEGNSANYPTGEIASVQPAQQGEQPTTTTEVEEFRKQLQQANLKVATWKCYWKMPVFTPSKWWFQG